MLNQSQMRQFNAQGYLVLDRFVDERLLQRIEAEYEAVLDQLIDRWMLLGELKETYRVFF